MAAEEKQTPMMMQYSSIKQNYKDEVVFFRLGDFYEMFNDDAIEVSRLLNLTLTHRQATPMCGVPYHAAKIYIARLLRLGKKIVICEQVGDIPKDGKSIAERKVVEIITPGTAVEAEYLEGFKANHLASLSISGGKVGFAYIDVTTGNFQATSWVASKMEEFFPKELNRASPSELILPLSLKKNSTIQNVLLSNPKIAVSYYPDWDFSLDFSYKKLTKQFGVNNLKAFLLDEKSCEVGPAGFLLDYLEKTTNANLLHIKSIKTYTDSDFLILDNASRKNLEVTENLRDGTIQFSLFECVNYTKTAMGNRLLKNWLMFPLTKINQIEERQSRIDTFFNNRQLLSNVVSDLSNILDVERLSGRIAMQKAHAKDLQALKNSLLLWTKIKSYLNQHDFSLLETETSDKICQLIANSILDDPSTSLTDGGIIKQGWSEELDKWRDIHNNFNKILSEYDQEEKEKICLINTRGCGRKQTWQRLLCKRTK